MRNFGWVSKRIPPARRFLVDGVSFSKHQVVAALSDTEQDRILKQSVSEGMTLSEVRQAARHVKRRRVSTGQAELKGKYRTILVDTVLTEDTVDAISKWAILANTRLHAAVFIRHEEARRFDIAQLLEAWGLTHKTTFVFNRVIHQGPSAYNSIIHEYLLLAVRGRLAPDRLVPMEPSIQVSKSDGPVPVERLQELIRRLYDGPYLLVQAADTMTSWEQKEGQR